MSRPIAISLSPNTERNDIVRAWQTILRPWHDAETVSAVEKELTSHFGGRVAILVSSGRRALFEGLQAADIGKEDEVITQAFTCSAVPAAIYWTGARPIYADIAKNTFNIDPRSVTDRITAKTKAIIVQHTFGIPGPIAELVTIAKKYSLVLIEDCAHALGATYHSAPIGTFGDVAIASFGRDKTLSCVFGGAVASSNDVIVRKVREQQNKLQRPPLWWVAQQLLHPLVMQLIIPTYFKAGIGKATLVAMQKIGMLSKTVELREKTGGFPVHFSFQFSSALAELLQLQLKKLERYTQRRRHIAQQYRVELNNSAEIQLPVPPPDSEPSWLRFPVLVKNAQKMRRAARRASMLLGDWYDTPLAPSDVDFEKFGYTFGSCPVAEEASLNVINLPTYPLMSDEQVEKVVSFMKGKISK